MAATCLAGLVGGTAIAMVLLIGSSSALFGRAPTTDAELLADRDHVSVIDGTTLRLNATVVELAGIRPPDAGRSCIYPASSPVACTIAATNALAQLVRGRSVTCQVHRQDYGGRPAALCTANGIELNHALVAGGWALADPMAADLRDAEMQARAAGRGLWREPGPGP